MFACCPRARGAERNPRQQNLGLYAEDPYFTTALASQPPRFKTAMKPATAALHLVPRDEMLDAGAQKSVPYSSTRPAAQRTSDGAALSDEPEHDGARSAQTASSARSEQQRPTTWEAHDGVRMRKALTKHLSAACFALRVDDRRTDGPWRGYTPATSVRIKVP